MRAREPYQRALSPATHQNGGLSALSPASSLSPASIPPASEYYFVSFVEGSLEPRAKLSITVMFGVHYKAHPLEIAKVVFMTKFIVWGV